MGMVGVKMKDNIESFELLVARIFEKLYRSFPQKVEVSPIEVVDHTPNGYWDDYGNFVDPLSHAEKALFHSTVQWLIDDGYVIGPLNRFISSKITLSSKGLQTMQQDVSSSDVLSKRGSHLTKALADGNTDLAICIVSEALGPEALKAGITKTKCTCS